MSINYIEKGVGLHDEISSAGHWIKNVDRSWYSSDDKAVQLIIDNYDPLVIAKKQASDLINNAAGDARARHATDVAYQGESYTEKLKDCQAFKDAGYPESTIDAYPYVMARAARRKLTGEQAANEIINMAVQWKNLLFYIENERDAANEAVENERDFKKCLAIAEKYQSLVEPI